MVRPVKFINYYIRATARITVVCNDGLFDLVIIIYLDIFTSNLENYYDG